jgi:hypothetical protein
MSVTLITTVIALIEQFLPLLGTSAATADLIVKIIAALEQIVPLVIEFVPTAVTSVQNIIALLKGSDVTPEQWAQLDAIDMQLDAANDAAVAAVDPDAPVVAVPPINTSV